MTGDSCATKSDNSFVTDTNVKGLAKILPLSQFFHYGTCEALSNKEGRPKIWKSKPQFT